MVTIALGTPSRKRYIIAVVVILVLAIAAWIAIRLTEMTDPAQYRYSVVTFERKHVSPQAGGPELPGTFQSGIADWYFLAIQEAINEKDYRALAELAAASVRIRPAEQFDERGQAALSLYPGHIQKGHYIGYEYLGDFDKWHFFRLLYKIEFREINSNLGRMRLYFLWRNGEHRFRGFEIGPQEVSDKGQDSALGAFG